MTIPSSSNSTIGSQPELDSHDPYAVLGLQRGANPREIKRAYFTLVREYPPESDPTAFKKVRAAYEKLRNPEEKAKTDLFLFRPPSPWSPRKRRGKLHLDLDPNMILQMWAQASDLGQTTFPNDLRTIDL